MTANSAKHPKGLYFVFSISIAERFGYYGMRALFVLYMIKALMIDKELSSLIYGNYTGLVYLTPLIGGYVADKYWGDEAIGFTGYGADGYRSAIYVFQCALFSTSGSCKIADVYRPWCVDIWQRLFQTKCFNICRAAI